MAKVRKKKKQQKAAVELVDSPLPSLGERLRQARLSQGLDEGVVADRLHLKRVTVVALEEEDYERLPARVFVRGYYRNYARLLGIPEEPLLKEFDQRCPEGEECVRPPASAVTRGMHHEIRSSHGLVRLMTAVVLLSVIAGLVLWWKDRSVESAAKIQPVVEKPAPEEKPARPAPNDGQQEKESPATVAGENTPAEPPAENAEKPVEASARQPETPPAAENGKAPDATGEQPEAAEVAAEPADKAAEPSGVEVRFKQDSWVNIRSADGAFQKVGLQKAGTVLRLEGKPPYQITLGNAGGVALVVNGNPYDLTQYIKRNVARLTLTP